MEGDKVVLQDIFKYIEEGTTADGKVVGQMRPTGLRPVFTPRLDAAGFRLPCKFWPAAHRGVTPAPAVVDGASGLRGWRGGFTALLFAKRSRNRL